MTANEFEQELKALDPRFSVVDNPNRPGLSNIFFEGRNFDLPAISSFDIREEADPRHVYEFPNGARARFWSRPEILGRVNDFLKSVDKNRAVYEDKDED